MTERPKEQIIVILGKTYRIIGKKEDRRNWIEWMTLREKVNRLFKKVKGVVWELKEG